MTQQDAAKAWFSRRIEEHMGALYGAALRLTRSGADAEDLVAETTIKAWCALDSLIDRGRFRPWIFRILRNCYISDYRKQSVRPGETSIDDPGDYAANGDLAAWLIEQPDEFLHWWAGPEHTLSNRLLGEQIMSAIEALPGVFRLTVLLINVEGLTYDEAAAVLGVPPGTVRSRMKRGRALLQKRLWELAKEAGLAVTNDLNR